VQLGGVAHQVGHAGQVDQDLARAFDRLGFVGGRHAGQAAQVFFGSLDGVFAFANAGKDGHHRQRHHRQRDQQHQAAAKAVQVQIRGHKQKGRSPDGLRPWNSVVVIGGLEPPTPAL
jgi:hypothetical protein